MNNVLNLIDEINSVGANIKDFLNINDYAKDIEIKCAKNLNEALSLMKKVEKLLANEVKENKVLLNR